MQNQTNKSTQSNFLVAVVLSMLVLTGWMYFLAPEKPAEDAANANTNVSQNANSNAETKPAPEIAKEEEKKEHKKKSGFLK